MRCILLAALSVFALSCEQNTYQQGRNLYEYYCANCHMGNGSGLEGLIPPLAGADSFLLANRDRLACYIQHGLKDTIEVAGRIYAQEMPGVKELTPYEISNLLNYLQSEWAPGLGYFRIDEIKETLENCK